MSVKTQSPLASSFWKSHVFPGTPAEHNAQVVEKNELHIRIHGNTLFAGWTVPIPLSPQFNLPPSCILLEGYGKVKTDTFTVLAPSGRKMRTVFNGLEAFVTFFHPSSKYSGPGTDGLLGREAIMEFYPP